MIVLLKNGYYADSATSLIFRADLVKFFMDMDLEKRNKISMMKYVLKEQLSINDNNKKIKTIQIHPVDKYCLGSCKYCYLNIMENSVKQKYNYLSAKRLDDFLSTIKERLTDEGDLLFKFSGGSCFLHNNLMNLINVCEKYDNNVNLRFLADLFYPEDKYKKMIEVLEELDNKPNINSISMYISVDLGSNTRYSSSLNMSSCDVLNRAKEIIDLFGYRSKFRIELKTNFNKDTDPNLLLKETNKLIDKNCWLIYNPVKDLEWSPTIEHCKKITDILDNNFDVKVLYLRELVILNNYIKNISLNMDNLKTRFRKLEEGVFMIDPYYSDCPGYLVCSGVSSDKYLACYIGYMEEDNIEDTIVLKKESLNYYKHIIIPEECNNCDYLGVCNRCIPRRKFLSCSDVPVLKWWEEYIWKKRILTFNPD